MFAADSSSTDRSHPLTCQPHNVGPQTCTITAITGIQVGTDGVWGNTNGSPSLYLRTDGVWGDARVFVYSRQCDVCHRLVSLGGWVRPHFIVRQASLTAGRVQLLTCKRANHHVTYTISAWLLQLLWLDIVVQNPTIWFWWIKVTLMLNSNECCLAGCKTVMQVSRLTKQTIGQLLKLEKLHYKNVKLQTRH